MSSPELEQYLTDKYRGPPNHDDRFERERAKLGWDLRTLKSSRAKLKPKRLDRNDELYIKVETTEGVAVEKSGSDKG